MLAWLVLPVAAVAGPDAVEPVGIPTEPAACDNATAGGLIQGNETGCPSPVWDPSAILNVALPTGGSGTLEYLWVSTSDGPNLPVSLWTPIPNSNASSYDPGPITETTWYRRCARRSGCTEYVAESNIVEKTVSCCSDVTDGGLVAADQSGCAPFAPDTLLNVSPAAGGGGTVEYSWWFSTVSDTWFPGHPDWSPAPGLQDLPDYAPGTLTQTTFFIRLAKGEGCSDFILGSNVITIAVFPNPNLSGSASPPLCAGVSDGAILLLPVGGTPPYQYQWSLPAGDTSFLGGLSGGLYGATVTDAAGCTASNTFLLEPTTVLSVNILAEPVTCAVQPDGQLTVAAVTDGTPAFSYAWSNAPGLSQASQSGLASGNYSVTVTDALGCIGVGSAFVPPAEDWAVGLAVSAPSCPGGSDGTAAVTSILGGTALYGFLWNDPAAQPTPLATGLTPGGYTVLVTALANGCTDTFAVLVPDTTGLQLSTSHTNAGCGGQQDGTASVAISGGQAPYLIQWDDPSAQSTATASQLAAGNYTVTVTDAQGCSAASSVTVETPFNATFELMSLPASCFDSQDGTASVSILTGDPTAIQYLWNDPAGTQGPQADGLAPGTYQVTLTDNGGCLATGQTVVSAPPALLLSGAVDTTTCPDSPDGTATVSASGGSGTFQYAWDAPGAPTTPLVDGLPAGSYTVTVTDQGGCTAVLALAVPAGPGMVLQLTTQDLTCAGIQDGSAQVAVDGGTAPYAYAWDDPQQTSGPLLSGIGPGGYTVTVTDGNGCEAEATAFIFTPPVLTANIAVQGMTCDTDSAGTATALGSGGVPPYLFAWSTGSAQSSLQGLSVGTYTLTVTDSYGCSTVSSADITALSNLVLDVQVQDESCHGATDGAVTVMVGGGAAPLSWLWSQGATSSGLQQLAAGSYAVTVTDANLCTVAAVATVGSPDALLCSIAVNQPVGTYNGNEGVLVVQAAGGTGSYQFAWSDGSTASARYGLPAGSYAVTVTDAAGCTCAGAVGLENPSKVGDLIWLDQNENGRQDAGEPGFQGVKVWLVGTTAGGQPVDRFVLSGADGYFAFDGLQEGDYQLTLELPAYHVPSPVLVGADPTLDNDFDPLTGSTAFFHLPQGVYDEDRDGGLIFLDEPTDIGDFVWEDLNHNGLQDGGEPGWANVPVRLFKIPSGIPYASTLTNATGQYLFVGVPPGKYYLEFGLFAFPNGYVFTTPDVGTDDSLDSDVMPSTGRTDTFEILPFTLNNLSFDAGVHPQCSNVVSGGSVGYDEQLCGAGADPSLIENIALPAGGFGTLQYLWLQSTTPVYNGPGDPNWVPVPNSDMPAYDPGPVSQTTYFIRCARREGCGSFSGESNIITKEILPLPVAGIQTAPDTICLLEGADFVATPAGPGAFYHWMFGTDAVPAEGFSTAEDDVYWFTAGSKAVSLEVTRLGCAAQVQHTVFVEDCGHPIVVIEDFLASLTGETVGLSWKIRSNAPESVVFRLERAIGGLSFQPLGLVSGEAGRFGYAFADERPFRGRNVYRLRWYVRDDMARSGQSDILTVEGPVSADQLALVFPNPVRDLLQVELVQAQDAPVDMELLDARGRLVRTYRLEPMAAGRTLDLTDLPEGPYLLCLRREGRTQYEKIIRRR
ncbi:MAG: hypothetical protein RLY31_1917 [Bacteroidota bacterium]